MNMNRKIMSVILVVAMLVTMAFSFSWCQQKKWPEKPITIVVSSTAGGGTDLGNRVLGAAMEKELGQKINVINIPAGGGGAAAHQVFSAPHDGYNLLGFFEGIFSFAVMNAHNSTTKDWEYFLLGGTPGVMSVRADSPYNSVEDVIMAMKDKPGQIKLANSSVGCIWDIKAALLKNAAGIDYKYMPYQGSNPSILACLSGEVDVIITGLGEQAEFLAAKKLKPLAMIELEDMDVPGYTKVPSITKAVPKMKDVLPLNQTIGFAVPADAPKEVIATLDAAFKKAVQSEEVKKYAKDKYLVIAGSSGVEMKEIAKNMEATLSWILYDNGVAPKSPEEFKIARPVKK